MNYVLKQILIHVLLPLIAGLLIYFFFRPDVWFMQFFDKREALISFYQINRFQKLLIFSGPDFCWAYSLASALFIWEKWQGRFLKYFPTFVFFLIVLSELGQLFISKIFTFDWFDVVAALIAFALSYLLVYRNVKK